MPGSRVRVPALSTIKSMLTIYFDRLIFGLAQNKSTASPVDREMCLCGPAVGRCGGLAAGRAARQAGRETSMTGGCHGPLHAPGVFGRAILCLGL